MRNVFKRQLKYKLIAVILIVTLSALLPYLIFVSFSHVERLRKDMREYSTALARNTGYNTASAISFDDRNEARQTLAMLSVMPEIQNVALFDTEGRLFVEYQAANAPTLPIGGHEYGAFFKDGHFIICEKIIFQNRYYGDIFLQSSTAELDKKIWRYLSSILIFIFFLLVLVVFLSWRLQHYISAPILHLADSFREVSLSHNYSLTQANRYDDEIGELYAGFNEMMEQIRFRDLELRQHQENLEALVNERTHELQEKNIELLRAKDMAETANRLKSIFLANTSHEIRTPMNAILGFTNILLEDESDPEKKFYLNTVRTSGENLLKLINNILDLSKIEANRLEIYHEVFSPRQIFYHLETLFTAKARESHLYFVINGLKDMPAFVRGDSHRINQVLLNILGNAFKFTQKGGVTVNCLYNTPYLKVSVKDTGIGIPPEKHDVIFEPFIQADNSTTRKFGGTGLGLSIAKHMLRIMGGAVELKSETGQGAEFIIQIPCPEAPPDFPPQPEPAAPSPGASNESAALRVGNRKNIAILDDNETSRELITSILQRNNYNIFAIHKTLDFIEMALKHNINMMLISLKTKETDAIMLNNRIKQDLRTARLPVIMYCDAEEILYSFTCHIADIIPKPTAADETINRIAITLKVYPEIKNIFFIESDRGLTNPISRHLDKSGYHCRAFNSPIDALKEFKSGIQPDLIIIDPVIPFMDGFEFLKILRDKSTHRRLPVILTTAKHITPGDFHKLKHIASPLQLPSEKEPFLTFLEQYFAVKTQSGAQLQKNWFAKMAGDEPLIHILREAIQALPGKTQEIEQAILMKDFENIRFHSHNLKGMCLNLKMDEIADITENINREAHKKNINMNKIHRHLLELKEIVHWLPPAGNTPAGTPISEKHSILAQNITLRILAAEDDPVNQRLISTYFKRLGLIHDIADNGQIALDMLRKKKYDLVFMDIQMPVMDGVQAVQEIRRDENLKHIHVIALTANAVVGDQEKYLEAGCDDYMSKPVTSAAIADRIKSFVAGKNKFLETKI